MEEILRDYFRLDENLEEHYREWSCRDGFFKQTCGEFVGRCCQFVWIKIFEEKTTEASF